nr:MMPL family transporter [Micromonospora coriariae]
MARLPLTFMAQLGFVVAYGVLLDTIIVRSLLLPSLSHDLGRRIWATGRLAHAVDGEDGPAGRHRGQPGRPLPRRLTRGEDPALLPGPDRVAINHITAHNQEVLR